eukprot:206049_1
MVASLIAIMFIMKAINAQEQYALAAEDRCFDAKAYAAGYEFSPPYDGEIIGVKLQHKSGLVTCGGGTANSFWGCGAFPTRIYIEMIKHDATTITYYPTATTDGISSLNTVSNCDCSVIFYFLSEYGGGSEFIDGPAPNPSKAPIRNYLTTTSDGEGTQLMISIAINSC